jgi:periplasmic divalent cation tolerance protein
MKYVLMYVPCPTKEEARKIGKTLVERRIAACVNVTGKVDSIYWWEGKIEDNHDYLLLVKTREDKGKEITDLIKEMHSYDCPCIVAFPIVGGSKEYGEWIDDTLDA